MNDDLINQFKGLEIQLFRVSAQLEFLTDYIMKDSSQAERDKMKEKIIAEVQEKVRIIDMLDDLKIKE